MHRAVFLCGNAGMRSEFRTCFFSVETWCGDKVTTTLLRCRLKFLQARGRLRGTRIGRHLQAFQGVLTLLTLQHDAGVDDLPEFLAVTDGCVFHIGLPPVVFLLRHSPLCVYILPHPLYHKTDNAKQNISPNRRKNVKFYHILPLFSSALGGKWGSKFRSPQYLVVSTQKTPKTLGISGFAQDGKFF